MYARQLTCDLPPVLAEHTVGQVAATLVTGGSPGALVVGPAGTLLGAVTAGDLVDLLVPGPVRESPALSRAYDERHADRVVAALGTRPLRDVLPHATWPAAAVPGRATVVEIAAVMSRARSPLVLVTEDGRLTGAVTADRLLESVAAFATAHSA